MKTFNYHYYFNVCKDPIKYIGERIGTHNIDWGGIISKIQWGDASEHQKLVKESILRFKDRINWHYVSSYHFLPEEFIRIFSENVIWDNISLEQVLSEKFIEEFQDKVNWYYVSSYQSLSEEFIEKFQDKVFWYSIFKSQVLSEKFIEKFQDKDFWDVITLHQVLSEKFIEKFQSKIDWKFMSKYQRLSDEFIVKFKDSIHWSKIRITPFLFKNFRDKIPKEFLIGKEFNCGEIRRVIYITYSNPAIIRIGCFKGGKREAVKEVRRKYRNQPQIRDDYISKIRRCFNQANNFLKKLT